MRLLLHACCGPCSLEPVRLLQETQQDITIAYTNPNIHPYEEYVHRRDVLFSWAQQQGICVLEGVYDVDSWQDSVGEIAQRNDFSRADRCRACYRLRLSETARMAAEAGLQGIASTLAVSPYQFIGIIEEELKRAAEMYGLVAVFEDYRPFYSQATRLSRSLGMYRQNYCGCSFSMAEAAAEREERKRNRNKRKQDKRIETIVTEHLGDHDCILSSLDSKEHESL